MQFIDLSVQQKRIRDKIEKNILSVLDHGKYIMGPEVQELEKRLGAYVGTQHAMGCASGTDALMLALMALDVGPGDAVFTSPFTFIATAEVISLLGATPIFVDIDPPTFNIDPDKLDHAMGEHSTVSGGRSNTASGFASSVAGGSYNEASDHHSSVTGGEWNEAAGLNSWVGGGLRNKATVWCASVSGGSDNDAAGFISSVTGGHYNKASGTYATVVGGGSDNPAYGNEAFADYSSILGGIYNIAGDPDSDDHSIGERSTISGGDTNNAYGTSSTVSGGKENVASGHATAVGGGRWQEASTDFDFKP